MTAGDEKIAVVLFNIGGPLKPSDIRPYLFNFFMDRNIIRVPAPLRVLIAALISWRRSRGPAQDAYGQLGGQSPLLANTRAQAEALEGALRARGREARVFIAMRYWHPRAEAAAAEVAAFGPDRIVVLPLYPQFSTSTSFSSFENWRRAARRQGLAAPTVEIGCYPDEEGFVAASARAVTAGLLDAAGRPVRVLFSAHGLPESFVKGGDPYQHQCEVTAGRIVAALNRPDLDWQMCYQSRVGPARWIGPSTEEALARAASDGVGVVIYPLAFVSEHVETLVEIEVEYRHRAADLGVPFFIRVPTVGTDPAFISGLADVVEAAGRGVYKKNICDGRFRRCYCQSMPEARA